jgi:hypothetical protein
MRHSGFLGQDIRWVQQWKTAVFGSFVEKSVDNPDSPKLLS